MNETIFIVKSVYPEAEIFLAGDLNAKTKEFLDYIPNDDLDLVFGDTDYTNDTFNINRNSKDINIYNRFGFSLINMCCENAYDLDGNIICISNKGKSLVDYIIASASLFDKCAYFCIGMQYFSEHLRLYVHNNYMYLTWVYQIVIIIRMLLAVSTNTNRKIHLKRIFSKM